MAQRFINAPGNVVPELMQGVSLDSSRVALVDPASGYSIAVRSSLVNGTAPRRVCVVSGGGSGHEPMAAGYVGDGMLAGAVAGGVFASPSVPAISAMLNVVAPASAAILVIVMNYQGDRLNFKKAVDDHALKQSRHPVSLLLVGDDVALPENPEPRGLAGTVFVLKVAGAAADQGKPLPEVLRIADAAARNVSTFGVALEPSTIPGQQVDTGRLARNEVELGMGIHGEPGAEKICVTDGSLSTLTNDIVNDICSRLDEAMRSRQSYSNCSSLAVMVNNLGAVSQAEMLIVCKAVADYIFHGDGQVLHGHNYRIYMYSGHYITSLQMTGVSITSFTIPDDGGVMESLLKTPTSCTAWNTGFEVHPPSERLVVPSGGRNSDDREEENSVEPTSQVPGHVTDQAHGGLSSLTAKYILAITGALTDKAQQLNNYDRKVGDGDTGDTASHNVVIASDCANRHDVEHAFSGAAVKRGCERVISDLGRGAYAHAVGKPSLLFKLLANSTAEAMGGTTGNLTAVFLNAAADSFGTRGLDSGQPPWRVAFVEGTHAVMREGGADIGSRTMIDALKPAADVLASPEGSLAEAAQAAREGCESTKSMTVAKFGRSTYLSPSELLNQPDPGAVAIETILDALVQAASKE